MRIGLFGGTFNPVHLGHLILAEGAREALKLDQILWIPTHLPPHKAVAGNASPKDRAAMVELAIQGHAAFQLSRVELDRPPPSYTIDTVRKLTQSDSRGSVPSGSQWFFLIGSDCAKELAAWREKDRLLTLVQFVVIPRPGHTVARLPDGVMPIQVETVDVSASVIRRRVAEGHSVRYLVPDPVRVYIEQHGLYR